jgi:hypothetical protein
MFLGRCSIVSTMPQTKGNFKSELFSSGLYITQISWCGEALSQSPVIIISEHVSAHNFVKFMHPQMQMLSKDKITINVFNLWISWKCDRCWKVACLWTKLHSSCFWKNEYNLQYRTLCILSIWVFLEPYTCVR